MATAEASIDRFLGVAYDLPRNRNSGYAYRALNVYEEKVGRLIRREGTRRAVEYQAAGPVMMVEPMFDPAGRTTGRGNEWLIQVDTEVRHLAATFSSGVAPTGPPEVDSATRTNIVQGGMYDGYHRILIKGKNFDQLIDSPITVTVGAATTGHVEFLSANALIALVDPARSPADDSAVNVTVTNPDGETGTLSGGYTFA